MRVSLFLRGKAKVFWKEVGRKRVKILWAALCFVLLAGSAGAQKEDGSAPPYVVVEAETAAQGEVHADKTARKGKFVSRNGAYQPIFTAAVPALTGPEITVWARYRGVSLQLKSLGADGVQTERQWVYETPKTFHWRSLGRYKREGLGAKVLIIRGPNAADDAGLDAVCFASAADFDPNTALPMTAPETVTVQVNWNRVLTKTTPLHFGLNVFHSFDPASATNKTYQQNMAFMRPGLIRLHNWSMMNDSRRDANGWMDAEKKRWDAEKIKKALTGAYAYGPAILLNIPGWPDWMAAKDGTLAPEHRADFARLCAELVQIVNRDGKRGVRYWEITNERDGLYYQEFHSSGGTGPLKDAAKPDKTEELAAIFNECAVAMKRVDPTILTGGPAVARPDFSDFITRFARATSPNLDFFSYHAYASGSRADSDAAVFDRSKAYGEFAARIKQALKTSGAKRPVPLFLDEYNISWTWETRDPRMTDAKSAVFDLLVISASVRGGADGTAAWNEKDGIYGKTGDDDKRRPSAQNFHWLNLYGVGGVAWAESSAENVVTAFAVKGTSGRAVWLVNRSEFIQPVRCDFGAAFSPGNAVKRFQIAADGVSEREILFRAAQSTQNCPPCSVTLLVFSPETPPR